MVMKVLRVGKDINICTSRGTVLHETVLCGKVEMVKTVLVHGINTVLWDSADRTIMDFMAEFRTTRPNFAFASFSIQPCSCQMEFY